MDRQSHKAIERIKHIGSLSESAAKEYLRNEKGGEPEENSAGLLERVVLLLDHCDAAMTAASSNLWHTNRDLALELNRRATRCRIMVSDLQNNTKATNDG